MKEKWAWLLAHLTLAGIIFGVLYLLIYNVWAWRGEVAEARLPVRAVQSARSEKWKEQPIPNCPVVIEKVLPAKDRKRIAKEFNRPEILPASTPTLDHTQGEIVAPTPTSEAEERVLGLFDVPMMPRGGEVLATLPPDGHLGLTFRENPPRFLSVRPVWGGGLEGNVLDWKNGSRIYGLLEPVHLRERWHLRLTAGGELRDGEPKGLVTIGAELRR